MIDITQQILNLYFIESINKYLFKNYSKYEESQEFFEKAIKIITLNVDKIDFRYMTNLFNNKGVNELSRD